MQIIIPMSGFGERFKRAGYSVPKPLIEVEGKPIVAHVIDMFPGETNFLFICNKDHLAHPDYRMAETLKKYCPTGKIIAIPPHKLGPVYAVDSVAEHVDLEDEVVVNYCDFTCYWDWQHFKDWVKKSKCDGAIPAYKGFHPHTLGTTNYAYMKESNHWLEDIQEKQPFTDNRMNEYASSGTYYFASGKLMLDAFKQMMAKNLNINGEYYVSLAYKPLLENNCAIAVYDLQHFMQWGTPDDVREYQQWSKIFHHLSSAKPSTCSVDTMVMPMAGLGQRFVNEGYTLTKPLIPVSGSPMVVQAAKDLPAANRYVFVLREDMPGVEEVSEILKQEFSPAYIKTVPQVTEGQACTALYGLDLLKDQQQEGGVLTFGVCDSGLLYDAEKLQALLQEDNSEVVVWAARGHANAIRNPHMYGWIATDGPFIQKVSVKQPLASPEKDYIVTGIFTFKSEQIFRDCVKNLMERNGRVNGEFYIDTCINDAIMLGYTCKVFEVDGYISWGTPNDLRTFEYWQSCFHKWSSHPYQIELDQKILPEKKNELIDRYQKTVPPALELPA